MYYPVFHFVVNNYGHGVRTEVFIVAHNYQEAYDYLNDGTDNIDWDYSDENSADTGYLVKLESDEYLPYEDLRI